MTGASRQKAAWFAITGFCFSTLILLWPALENGYPLATVDTARHLGMRLAYPVHPYGYNLWLFPLEVLNLPWVVVGAQATLAARMIWLAVAVVGGVRSPGTAMALTAALAAMTSAPYLASLLLPDYFAAIGLLAIALAPWVPGRAPALVALGTLIGFAGVTHYSHPPLFAGALAVEAALLWRLHRSRLPRLAVPACVIALACLVLAGANWFLFGRLSYSIAGPTFVLARLQEDGPAAAHLRERCATDPLRLCSQLDRMPMPHSEFLWADASAVEQAGGFIELSAESAELVRGTLLSRPAEVLAAVSGNTMRQLQSFVLFPDAAVLASPWFWKQADAHPGFGRAVRESPQFTRGLAKPWLGQMRYGVVIVSALALLPLCRRQLRAGIAPPVVFALTLSAGIVCNALIGGGLSSPDPRYGARVIWLLPLAAAILALSRDQARPDRE